MTNDKEDAAILAAIAADAGLPFVPTTTDAIMEKLDYLTLIVEQLIDLLTPPSPSFEWEQEDDKETMSA